MASENIAQSPEKILKYVFNLESVVTTQPP